jgi:elongation factor Ts
MAIPAKDVKALRDRTGAGMMDCKRALTEADGDIDKAMAVLREKGLAKAREKGARSMSEGVIVSYIHGNGRIGVLLELGCETDFVARNEEFQALAQELAMQVAASKPLYVAPDDVPADVVEAEKAIYRGQVTDKPENIQDKIIEGKLGKYYEEVCLLKQAYIREDSKTIEGLLHDAIAKLGENMSIRRFVRMELGETASEED